MTTPYVYITTRTDTAEPQQDVSFYFWGGVVTLLLLAAVVVIVMYGMSSTATEASAVPAATDRALSGVAATMLTQLPLYLGSTQYADPLEDA